MKEIKFHLNCKFKTDCKDGEELLAVKCYCLEKLKMPVENLKAKSIAWFPPPGSLERRLT